MVRYDDIESRARAEKIGEGFVVDCKGRLLPLCDEGEGRFNVAVDANCVRIDVCSLSNDTYGSTLSLCRSTCCCVSLMFRGSGAKASYSRGTRSCDT
jgi:hypothetical protein